MAALEYVRFTPNFSDWHWEIVSLRLPTIAPNRAAMPPKNGLQINRQLILDFLSKERYPFVAQMKKGSRGHAIETDLG